jgi:tetratricopeptide (TPR) repeat protein
LKLEPEYRSAQSNIGQALLKSGNPQEAYQWMKKAAEADPMDFLLRLQMGEAAEKSGQDSLARSLYQQVIQNAPQLPEAYLAMAGLFLKSGNVEETLRWCDITLQKFPAYGPAWFNKGVVYYQQGKISEAKALFEESAKLGHPQAIAVLQQGLVK